MARSARLPEPDDEPAGLLRLGAVYLGAAIARNPMLVGGVTAFLVALSYVSANALWYQPHFHDGAFFATRTTFAGPPAPRPQAADRRETTIRFERSTDQAAPEGDPVIRGVQAVLRELDYYDGEIDGLSGPRTRDAIVAYQKTIGLPVTGEIDAALTEQLGASPGRAAAALDRPAEARKDASEPVTTAAIAPVPTPRAKPVAAEAPDRADAERIVRIQAGLKAFGNDGIELDGVVGARTRSAIREFQSLFGLPLTGEPDEALYAKMREIGLTN